MTVERHSAKGSSIVLTNWPRHRTSGWCGTKARAWCSQTIIEKGKCNRARLSKLAAAIKKGGIDLRGAEFEKLVCSVDDGELAIL